MSIAFGSNLTVRSYRWTQWKAVRVTKSFVTQYDDDGSIYTDPMPFVGPAHIIAVFTPDANGTTAYATLEFIDA